MVRHGNEAIIYNQIVRYSSPRLIASLAKLSAKALASLSVWIKAAAFKALTELKIISRACCALVQPARCI
jgi:hypothetical protein